MNRRQKVLISLTISAVVLTVVCIVGALCADAARATDFSKKNLAPSLNCLFGTDWMGRDMLVRTLRGLSISVITILGYTAITGAFGAGGLGNLAYRFGYQRYQKDVMYVCILLLILLVCAVQIIFDLAARKADKRNR